MWYLYLDESGDLGFDFVNKKPSKFFTITILAVSSTTANRAIIGAVKKTIARKLNPKNKRKRTVEELKGNATTAEIKNYFFEQCKDVKFGIYSVTLNKKRVFEQLTREKERVYNFIARQVLDHIPFENNEGNRVEIIFDKCKAKPEISEFNTYIAAQLSGRLDPKIPLNMYHKNSQEVSGLQACDIFCWSVFQKYERKNEEYLKQFKDKVRFDDLYLKQKE